jgi:DNA-binding transcriptional ArsR family regulator
MTPCAIDYASSQLRHDSGVSFHCRELRAQNECRWAQGSPAKIRGGDDGAGTVRSQRVLDTCKGTLYLTIRLINRRVNHVPVDPLSTTFSALADPTRRAILARLALGETSVSDLAKPFDISAPAISKHLKVLERAGLITRGREAQWRPCRIEPGALRGVDDWLERYRLLWEERLDRLDAYLQQLQAKEKKRGRKDKR